MSAELLQKIQTLQFSVKPEAERLLLDFIGQTFDLSVQSVELRPQAVSLNSFNGFLTLDTGRRLFFKTHTEQDNVIGEYYNAKLLADAGYPVIQPLYNSTEAGQHLLIYEVIESPSVFDLAWSIEQGENITSLDALTKAQNQADDTLFEAYLVTLEVIDGLENQKAPIHQLFYHRLMGGRFSRFYGALPLDLSLHQDGTDPDVLFPDGKHTLSEVRRAHWEINGQQYNVSLDELVIRAVKLLNPDQGGPSIIGHGDAHNGNVFFQQQGSATSLLYFDPAFAGRHDPLLDLTKPLFHNVFAMWMYHPEDKAERTNITSRYEESDTPRIIVEHDYELPQLRHMFLRSKVERTLIPIVQELRNRNLLRDNWREFLKSALMCCPLLTMNLADANRFPPKIALLGFVMAMEMGAESQGERSLIDRTLDEVEQAL